MWNKTWAFLKTAFWKRYLISLRWILSFLKILFRIRYWAMSALYKRLVWLWSMWFWIVSVFVVATVTVTYWGLQEKATQAETLKIEYHYRNLDTQRYQALKTLAIDSPAVDEDIVNNLYLFWGRWFGGVVFFGSVLSAAAQIFSQPARSLFILLFARKHVVVAGLGRPEENGEDLVEELLKQWKSVVVVESDASHPGIEACERAGAIVLLSSPYEPETLKRTQIKRAESIIIIAGNDRENTGLAYQIYELLNKSKLQPKKYAKPENPFEKLHHRHVICMLGVTEPSLVDVIRNDIIYTDSTDRLRLNVFCQREMIARAMLRETRLLDNPRHLKKILVVGLGRELRMGEALVTRAAKDWSVDNVDRISPNTEQRQRMVIHVIDKEADSFVAILKSRVGYIDQVDLKPIPKPATRGGFRSDEMKAMLVDNDYDAVFVCLADEGMAVRQGIELRRMLDTIEGAENVTVVVRVMQEDAGFGPLTFMQELQDDGTRKVRKNLVAVGYRDRIKDVLLSMNPEVEMLAQVIHQQYLRTTNQRLQVANEQGDSDKAKKLLEKPARKPWKELDLDFKRSNREQAYRLAQYVEKRARANDANAMYSLTYAPHESLSPPLGLGWKDNVAESTEIELLAKLEHDNWIKSQKQAGWRLDTSLEKSDPVRKLSPFLIPWDKLDDDTRAYNRDIINRLAVTFAKADYKLVPIPSTNAATKADASESVSVPLEAPTNGPQTKNT